MSATLLTPAYTHQAPSLIAPETFVIHHHNGEGTAPVMVPLNTMLIRGAEPVVVDTGVMEHRDQWFADLFGLVEPDDIRWIFISHDDVDHTGNLNELVRLAPNATVVMNWFMWERMGATLEVPLHRMKWVVDGESFHAGDRTLELVRPPVFDSPTTRGLFDPTTGVYWAADAFAGPMAERPVTNARDLDREMWEMGMVMFHQYISPWFELVDDAKYQRSVDRVQSLASTTIAGCHAPTIGADLVDVAFHGIRTFPQVELPPMPADHELLDQLILGSMAASA